MRHPHQHRPSSLPRKHPLSSEEGGGSTPRWRDRLAAFWLLPLILGLISPLALSANPLLGHPSPYLALHGEDPIHWQDWSSEILQQAAGENKPIFLSSGYFSCHWCHVMQQESFRSPAIAALLNQHFIPVKIDRELHPEIDEYLMEFVRKNYGTAGWPLNVFLTPQGYPIAGLSYAPAERFTAIVEKFIAGWKEDGKNLAYNARLLAMGGIFASPKSTPQLTPAQLRASFFRQLGEQINELEGGFGDGSRFPMAPQYLTLLELLRSQDGSPPAELEPWLRLTLDNTARLGMRDHINGGFFRYTLDPDQRTPHFEKMLYNQALQARLYLSAARHFNSADYRQVAWDSLDFALSAMHHAEGGYISSISASDQAGREGAAYLWSQEELSQQLTPEQRDFARRHWSLGPPAPFSGGSLPLLLSPGDSKLAAPIRQRLQQAAAAKAHPSDHKRIASWNGLLLSSLADALSDCEPPNCDRYRAAGQQLEVFIRQQLWDGHNLHRSISAGQRQGEATLEDYAFVAQGLAQWAHATQQQAPLELAQQLVTAAWPRFFHPKGWRPAGSSALPGMTSEPLSPEGPLPSPSASLIELTFTLEDRTNLPQARQALRLSYGKTSDQPFWYPSHLEVLSRRLDKP